MVFVSGTALTYLVSALSTHDLAGIVTVSVLGSESGLIPDCALESLGQVLKKDAVVYLSPNLQLS